jgi:hypothetical protein
MFGNCHVAKCNGRKLWQSVSSSRRFANITSLSIVIFSGGPGSCSGAGMLAVFVVISAALAWARLMRGQQKRNQHRDRAGMEGQAAMRLISGGLGRKLLINKKKLSLLVKQSVTTASAR